jgi:hypothetical protein
MREYFRYPWQVCEILVVKAIEMPLLLIARYGSLHAHHSMRKAHHKIFVKYMKTLSWWLYSSECEVQISSPMLNR